MNHRLTPARKAFVPPAWFLILSILSVVSAAAWLGWLLVDNGGTPSAGPTAPVTSSATPTPTPSPTPTETATPEPTPAPDPEPERTLELSVLNNTSVAGLAGQYSDDATAAGWNVALVGNWQGAVSGNTVFYPEGGEAEAQLLADDLGIDLVEAAYAPMNLDRLTVILAGPQ